YPWWAGSIAGEGLKFSELATVPPAWSEVFSNSGRSCRSAGGAWRTKSGANRWFSPGHVTFQCLAVMKSTLARVRNNGGFTLIELIVVLMLMGIVAALAEPSMTEYLNRSRTRRALDRITGDILMTRM